MAPIFPPQNPVASSLFAKKKYGWAVLIFAVLVLAAYAILRLENVGEYFLEKYLNASGSSLFLGRMTQMSDGMSFILERNPSL